MIPLPPCSLSCALETRETQPRRRWTRHLRVCVSSSPSGSIKRRRHGESLASFDVFAPKKGNVWLYSECITTVRCTVRHRISQKHRDQVDATRTVNQAIICRGTGRSSGCVVPWCLINYIPWEKTPGCFLFLRDAEVNGAFSQTPLPASNWSNLKIISAVFVVSGAPAEYSIIK